jgi:hypothetical protein
MAPQSQCPRRRSIGRLEQAVSNTVPRILDLFHLVPDPSGEWPGLGPRRYRRSTASGHRSASGRLLGLRLGRRRVLRRRRFWRRILRRRRFGGRRRSFGELVMQFSKEDPRGGVGRDSGGGKAHQRADRLRACPRFVGLRLHPHFVGQRACACNALAAHQLHAVERAADLSDSASGLYRRRSGWRWFLAACAGRGRIVRHSSNSSSAASPIPGTAAES